MLIRWYFEASYILVSNFSHQSTTQLLCSTNTMIVGRLSSLYATSSLPTCSRPFLYLSTHFLLSISILNLSRTPSSSMSNTSIISALRTSQSPAFCSQSHPVALSHSNIMLLTLHKSSSQQNHSSALHVSFIPCAPIKREPPFLLVLYRSFTSTSSSSAGARCSTKSHE